jgi:hypothetical protein
MEFSVRNRFESVEQAKAFLIGKIEEEAERVSAPLNVDEIKALNFSPDEPITEWGLIWAHVRGAESPEGKEFEDQMIKFLEAAYEHDRQAGTSDVKRYQAAQEMFSSQTNWIVIIARKAFQHIGLVA